MATTRQQLVRARGFRIIRLLKIMGSGPKRIISKLRVNSLRVKAALFTKWSGANKESPKIITFEPSLWRAFQKCAIHLVPITATAVLAAMNLVTYFIGADYKGHITAADQAFDNLALQITAKLYVSLLDIATLITTYMF
jgi:hypothetical protein